MAGQDAGPGAMREGGDVRQPRLKCTFRRTRRTSTHPDDRPPPRRERRHGASEYVLATDAGTLRDLPRRPGQQFGLNVGHPGAVANPGTKKALGHKLLEDRDHRVSCDTELPRGRAGRRQSRAGVETAIEDRRAQAVVDLSIERYAGMALGIDPQWQEVQVSHNTVHWFYERFNIGSFHCATMPGP